MRARLLPAAVLLGACASVPPPPPAVPPEERPAAAIEGERPPGSPDLVRLLQGLVAGGPRPGEEESLRDLHRIALPDHIPDIVRLLEPARDEPYRVLLWILCNLADNTDRHRETVAGALLYARAALLAEIDGKPGPRLADFRFPGKGPATAAAFVERYEALLGGRESEHQEEFPEAWLDRWKRQEAPATPPEGTPASEVEAFTPAEATARARELAVRPPDAWAQEGVDLDRLLPLIEAAAPAAFEEHLRAWMGPDGPPGPRNPGKRDGGSHWTAMAARAIAGDAAARAEFLAFLREDRISVYDESWDDITFTLNGDPEALEHWRSRIDANCCLRFWADRALRRWYPTMPEVDTVRDTDDGVRRIRDWWTRWKDRMRWSRLADGWVPVAE